VTHLLGSDYQGLYFAFLIIGLRKKLMDGGHLAAGEAGSPAKKWSIKVGGAAAYNAKFDSKWCSKYPVKASSSQTYFVYVACSL
jgi:hypothetical protein